MRRYIAEKSLIRENLAVLRRMAGDAVVYGVLKLDGYGLGLEAMARLLADGGIDHFCVTQTEDALRLADTGVPAREILLLRPLYEAREIERMAAIPALVYSIGSPEEAALLNAAARRLGTALRAHVMLDTGLGRYGVPWDDVKTAARLYADTPQLAITGTYTHFAAPGREKALQRHAERFRAALDGLAAAGVDTGRRHCANSMTFTHHPELRMDAVRLGSALLGRVPGGEAAGLRRVGYCEAEIIAVRTLPAGETVGYGAVYKARRPMRVAVADVGAVHGLHGGSIRGRCSLRTRLGALYHDAASLPRGGADYCAELDGHPAPIVGEVFSECAVLDVTGLECRPGDIARLPLNPLYAHGMERVWRP